MIDLDITKQLDQFNKMASDMPFIISKSINNLAFERGRDSFSKEMNKEFVVRDKNFSSAKSIRVDKSDKKNLQISLYHVKKELGLQQFGGIETPKGKKLAIPNRKTLSSYAGVSNTKKIPKALDINTLMNNAPRSRSDKAYATKGLKPFVLNKGIFIRTSSGLRALYTFKSEAQHNKEMIDFQKNIERTYNANIERFLNREYLRLIKKS